MNELQHYGVPGMKWGVRRSGSKSGGSGSSKKTRVSERVMKNEKVAKAAKKVGDFQARRRKTQETNKKIQRAIDFLNNKDLLNKDGHWYDEEQKYKRQKGTTAYDWVAARKREKVLHPTRNDHNI